MPDAERRSIVLGFGIRHSLFETLRAALSNVEGSAFSIGH
jgi:hypothetical protein